MLSDGFRFVCPNICFIFTVRLVGGNREGEGRLEIWLGHWGTVCDDGWDDNDAKVVCRQLGYDLNITTAVNARTLYGEGNGTIWLRHVSCRGTENNLSECTHHGWANTEACNHGQDVGVNCSGSLLKGQYMPLYTVLVNILNTRTIDTRV